MAGAGTGLLTANVLYDPMMTLLTIIHNAAPTIFTADLVTPGLAFSMASIVSVVVGYYAARLLPGSRTIVERNDQ